MPQISNTRRRHLSLGVGEYGALASRQNLLSSSQAFQLSREQANEVIDEVQEVVRARWRTRLVERDVRKEDIEKIADCFDPPAFEAPGQQGAAL